MNQKNGIIAEGLRING